MVVEVSDVRHEIGSDVLVRANGRRVAPADPPIGVVRPKYPPLFMEAGIGPGMSVLDIGSGAGDVAMLAAELVGPSGRVLGLDLNPAGLAVARERAAAAGLTNVEFIEADARAVPPGQTFDAAVGRIVLMYMADPAGTLRAVARAVNPGGRRCVPGLHPQSSVAA
jgi:ubiquinone/menaquinone biosynthesis C-methylase UbiE